MHSQQPPAEPAASTRITFPPGPIAALIGIFVLYDACSYFAPPALSAAVTCLHVAALLILALVNLRWALYLFVLSVFLADDISRIDPYGGYEHLVNLMTFSVGGVAIGNPLALLLVGLGILFAFLRWPSLAKPIRLNVVDVAMIVIVLVYAAATLHGIGAVLKNPRGALNDLNLPIMASGFYLLVRTHIRRLHHLMTLWNILLFGVAAKAAVWLAFTFLGIGLEFGQTLRVGFDSGSHLFILLIAYGLLLQQRAYPMPTLHRFTALAGALAAGALILISAGRMNWLFTIYVLVTLGLFGRLRDKIRWIFLGGAGAALLLVLLMNVLPYMFLTIGGMASTLKFWDIHKLENSPSTMVRIYEFRNVNAQLVDHRNLLLGEGPGSTFTDRYYPWPFGVTKYDYPHDEIVAREYQNTHSLISNLMLNVGYLGMVLYLAAVAAIFLACLRTQKRGQTPAQTALALSMVAFLPVMVYMSWSAKTYILLGVFFGIVGVLTALAGQEASTGAGTAAPLEETGHAA